MRISATVSSSSEGHSVDLDTAGNARAFSVPAKADGRGSAVNGGEFLMLALATCYCNDLYREADRLQIPVDAVEVEASAEFAGIGLAASNISYRVHVSSSAPATVVADLIRQTDAVAEIHNTLRAGVPVILNAEQKC